MRFTCIIRDPPPSQSYLLLVPPERHAPLHLPVRADFRFSGVCCAVKKLFKKANQILVLDGIGRIATSLRLLQLDLPYFQCTKSIVRFQNDLLMCFYFDTLVVYSNEKMFLGHFSWTLWTPNPTTMWMDELCRCAAGGWMIRAGSLHTPLMASRGLQRSQRVLSPRLISQRSRVWHGTDGVQTVTP